RELRQCGRDLLEEALKSATFYLNGKEIDVNGTTVRDKIDHAFKLLVENLYTHLHLVDDFTKDANELQAYLKADQDQMSLNDQAIGGPNAQAIQEIENYIRLQADMNNQMRVKMFYDRFHHAPYGWRELDIATMLAELLKEQSIRIRYNANYLEAQDDAQTLMTVFTRATESDKAIVLLRKKV